jgi:hypothetical protein
MRSQKPERKEQPDRALTPLTGGGVEALIEAFHSFESPLFERLVDEDGFAWWDLVRYDIQFNMLVERGLHPRFSSQTQKAGLRLVSVMRRGIPFVLDLIRLRHLSRRKIDAIIISRRPLEPITKVIEGNISGHFIFGGPTIDGHASPLIDKYHLDLFTKLVARRLTPPTAVLADARRVESDVQKHFNTELLVHKLIESKYRQHLAAKRIWSKLISMPASIERVVYVNDDTAKTLVWLCRQRGIETTEVQHGYMGASHIGFSYPKLDHSLMTMPDRTVITRDTGDIVYPSTLVGCEMAPSVIDIPTFNERDIDVLIGSGPRWIRRTQEMIEALTDSGLHVAIKLHPTQQEGEIDLIVNGVRNMPEVFSGKDDFLPVVRRSKIYLPANPGSTTSFEAVEQGCALMLYTPQGGPSTSVVNHLAAAIMSEPDEIVACIRDVLERVASGNQEKMVTG